MGGKILGSSAFFPEKEVTEKRVSAGKTYTYEVWHEPTVRLLVRELPSER